MAKLVGMEWPFGVGMTIDYWRKDGYLKLSVNVKELGHEIASEKIDKNFTAKTLEKIFKMPESLTETVKRTAKTWELDTEDFDVQLKVAIEDCMYELMAMM